VKANPPDPLLGRRLAEVEMMDGVRLMFADGSWIMVRASGTEPLLRIYAEAASEADVEALLAWGRSRARERSYR
jgi:phosphomannomutase